MTILRTTLLTAGLCAAAGGAHAAAFKAQFYADCAVPLNAARAMVESPPMDVGGTAKKAGEVAGALGKLGGFGVPGLGGLGKVTQMANQAATYSNYVADAATFAKKMQDDFPDPAARVAAYGDKMGQDADTIGEATLKVSEAQGCYETQFEALKAGVAAKEIRSSEASRRQREIQQGLNLAGDVLSDARVTMDQNMKSYNEAMTTEESGMGVNFGSLAQAAGAGRALAAGGGDSTYAAYYTQTNAYTNSWWQTYNETGNQEAATQAALAAANGTSAVKPYQVAYWQATADAAKAGGQPVVPAIPQVNLSTINALRGMSGGGAAFIGANLGVGLLQNAITNANAPEASAVAAEAPELSPAMKDAVLKTSADTAKFTDAYGLVAMQASKQSALAALVKAKLN